jgi:hypothetical protein
VAVLLNAQLDGQSDAEMDTRDRLCWLNNLTILPINDRTVALLQNDQSRHLD